MTPRKLRSVAASTRPQTLQNGRCGPPGGLKRIERGLGTLTGRQTLGVLGPAFISETRLAALRQCQTS
jgi:hypothetical protein